MRDDQLDRLFDKFDRLDERLGSIDVTLAKQETSLATHIRRTELAEQAIANVSADMKPLNKHVNMVQGALKFLTVIGTCVAIAAGVWKMFN